MKDTLTEMKSNSQGINSRVDEAEDEIRDLEDKEAENNKSEQEEKRFQKYEESVSSLWKNFKHFNICIIGVPGGE